jgi:transposase
MAHSTTGQELSHEDLLLVIEDLRQAVCERDQQIAERDSVIEQERAKYAVLQRMLFGRKSERVDAVDPKQGQLFNEAEQDATAAGSEAEQEEISPHIGLAPKKRGGRRRPTAELKRVEVYHDLAEGDKCCPWCACERPKIGEDRSEEIEVIPAQVIVKVHVRAKYGPCSCDDFVGNDEPAIVSAPAPTKIAPGSLFSNAAAAFFIVSKFADAMPFYRQEKVFARMGLVLSRATMARLTMRIAKELTPLFERFKRDIRGSPILRMDETVVQVLKEDERSPSAQSRMWVAMGYHDEKPIIYFAYHSSRSGDVAESIIGDGFKGFLQTDGYAGYTRVGRRPGIVHVGCWAHIRREFHEVYSLNEDSPLAEAMLTMIRSLYAVERRLRARLDAKELSVEEFVRHRKEEAIPIMESILAWLQEKEESVPPRSPLGKAISYALGQYARASRYIEHVLLSPDNNLVENAIRPFVVGRKNWHFSDTPAGAEASAKLYSLIETAKANGHEPYRYLCHLFDEFPKATTPESMERLLPYTLPSAAY